MLLGILIVISWPIQGLVAFVIAVGRHSFFKAGFDAKQSILLWVAITLGLSALWAFVHWTRIFVLPGTEWPDVLFYGPLLIWPLPVGSLLGRALVALIRQATRK